MLTLESYFLLAGLLGANAYFLYKTNAKLLFSTRLWGCICAAIVIFFMAGSMWIMINGPPFAIRDPSNKDVYFIYPAMRAQLGAELFIIFAAYACINLGFVMLSEGIDSRIRVGTAHKTRRESKNEKKPMAFTKYLYGGITIFVVSLIMLLTLFRRKMPGYSLRTLFD